MKHREPNEVVGWDFINGYNQAVDEANKEIDEVISFLATAPYVDLKTDAPPTQDFIEAWRAGYREGLKGAIDVLKQKQGETPKNQ